MKIRSFQAHIAPYLNELSGKGPFGGGSAAALLGAMAAALFCKAAVYSAAKQRGGARKRLLRCKNQALRVRGVLSRCADADAALFSAYITAVGKTRKRTALKQATRLVLTVCAQAQRGIGCIEQSYKNVDRWIFSDIMISFLFFEAALQASWYNVTINNRMLKDASLLRAAKVLARQRAANRRIFAALRKEFVGGKDT